MNAVIINCYKDNYYLSSLDEMISLLNTLDIETKDVFQFEVKTISRANYISKGLLDEILLQVLSKKIDVVVFNNDLSPLQVRNISSYLNVEVYDRSMVIIKIFELRAQTKEAKLQVEIASLKYNAARLVEKDAGYDQASGKGKNKGEGEKKIDLRKYQIREKIAKKEKELEKIQINRFNLRKKREMTLPLVTICGYTNAGKSTLLNRLIEITENDKKEMTLQEDKLFATLDTKTRLIKYKGYFPFLITDTVGFISNLPTFLINSFRSTLEEIESADLIVEVLDASSDRVLDEQEVNEHIISSLTDAKVLRIYNKIDKLDSIYPLVGEDELIVSLNDDEYIPSILELIDKNLSKFYYEVTLYIPYEDSNVFYEIKNSQCLVDYEETEKGFVGNFKILKSNYKKYSKYLHSF